MIYPSDNRGPDIYSFTRRVLIAVGVGAAVILLGLIAWRSLTVLLMIFAGFLLSLILRLIKDLISRYTRMPPIAALALTLILVFFLVGLFLMVFGPVVKEQAVDLINKAPNYLAQLKYYISQFRWGDLLIKSTESPQDLFPEESLQNTEVLSRIIGVFSSTFGALTNILFMLVIAIFFAAQPQVYVNGILRLVPPARRSRASEVLERMGRTLRGWLLGQLFSMTVLGTLVGSGLWLLGIPNSAVLGLFTAFMTFIPNLGPVLAFIPALLVALSEGMMEAFYVSIFYLIVQNIEGNFLTPMIQRKFIHVPPVLILSIQVLLMTLIGFLGILLAMPLLACMLVLVQMLYIEDVLGDDMARPAAASENETTEPSGEAAQSEGR
ncbi:MAG: AI-2E family transporter [Desulfurivibrio sp.]|nr:AI-2E family transporter [Desulfurivibrio sp.]